MSWRRIKCPLRHENVSEGICIDGVLYYLGDTSERLNNFVIVCFDVRSEKFKFIYPESYCELINYKGKLGVIYYDDYADDAIELRLWVLEDAEKEEWLEYAYTLRDDKFLDHYISVVGVAASGEIVLSMGDFTSKQPFYVFYFNPEKNTLQRVEIQGFGEYHEGVNKPSRVHFFVDDASSFYRFADHVEYLNVNDPKLLKSNIYITPFDEGYIHIESEPSSSEEEEEENEKLTIRKINRLVQARNGGGALGQHQQNNSMKQLKLATVNSRAYSVQPHQIKLSNKFGALLDYEQ
ncbi:unnamed protein product [Arabidopsis halleri]